MAPLFLTDFVMTSVRKPARPAITIGLTLLLLWPILAFGEITLSLSPPEYGTCGVVRVNGGVSSDAGDITGMDWDWGDGSENQSWFIAEHEYTADGTYDIRVTAHDTTGDSRTASVQALVAGAQGPVCDLTLRIHPEVVYLRDGKTSEQLRLEIRDGERRPVDPDTLQLDWTSSDSSLVQVDAAGLVSSIGYGQALITVTLTETGRQAFVEVFAGHLRTRPIFQYLSVEGESAGEVWVDMGNADGTAVDLAQHSVEFLCSNCAPEQPFQLEPSGEINLVRAIEEGDTPPVAILAVVDGQWAQNWAIVHFSQEDLGLTVTTYETSNIVLASATHSVERDWDDLIQSMRFPEMMELAFHWESVLSGGVWGGGGKQAMVNYVAPSPPICGASGNPIQLGSGLFDLSSCFFEVLEPGDMVHGFGIPFHELGHNFTGTHLRFADFADGGDQVDYNEGLATAMAMFACEGILRASDELGLTPDIVDVLEHSWLCWRNSMVGEWLSDYVASGANYEDLDPNIVDEILALLAREHGWGVLYRFYSTLLPRLQGPFPFSIQTTEEQATFFALALSEAADEDLIPRFRDEWGFPIDNEALVVMQPLVHEWVAQRDPASFAGTDKQADIGQTVGLNDAFVFDPLGDDYTVEWQVVQQPNGANAQFGDPAVLNTNFSADRDGVYTLGLTAANQWVTGEQDTVRISISNPDVIFRAGFE